MFYIEAFDAQDRPVLGNLDGQAVLRVRNYKRTKHYKNLRTLRTHRVTYYKIVTESGRVMEVL
jgi:hypothetical protein